jgi:hypothetical protein
MMPRSIVSSAKRADASNSPAPVAAATAMNVCGKALRKARMAASSESESANGAVSMARMARGGCCLASFVGSHLSLVTAAAISRR